MNPAVIEGWVAAPGAPADWDPAKHGPCGALPIRVDIENGLRFMRSAWTPTDAEIAAIQAGASVELGICALQHPVVNLGVGPVPVDGAGARIAYIVTQEQEDDGSVWVRVLALIGSRRFPAGMEIKAAGQEKFATTSADAASRLIGAIDLHARANHWID